MRLWAPLSAAGMLLPVLAGCATSSAGDTAAVVPPTASSAPSPVASPAPVATPPPSPLVRPFKPIGKPGGWRITTYYTLVQTYHGGPLKPVKGCATFHCKWGKDPLGSYPADFLKAIQTEGNGRITTGPNKGRYLNWSYSVGWWLDDSTRDSRGKPLKPWSSAAADKTVLARGQRFVVAHCGKKGRPVPAEICAKFRQSHWTVTDLFRPGYGGEHHADLYIGEETGPNFKKSPYYTTLGGATIGTA
ncbi:hypothetical protein [Spirillospora sp. CA-294931]|uniref:hypothetical protein n=1 Tax=Spirillospora sp. CA-294931 TaxID=3240042 RepID=UPI003D8DFA36